MMPVGNLIAGSDVGYTGFEILCHLQLQSVMHSGERHSCTLGRMELAGLDPVGCETLAAGAMSTPKILEKMAWLLLLSGSSKHSPGSSSEGNVCTLVHDWNGSSGEVREAVKTAMILT